MTIRSKEATIVDQHVAGRLRAARKQAGLSQSDAAERLNLTFQQVQKYENGANRISAGKLFLLAQTYGVSPSWFFDGLPEGAIEDRPADLAAQMLAVPYGVDLAKSYLAIPTNQARLVVANVAQALQSGHSS